jgi:hypothetical protein
VRILIRGRFDLRELLGLFVDVQPVAEGCVVESSHRRRFAEVVFGREFLDYLRRRELVRRDDRFLLLRSCGKVTETEFPPCPPRLAEDFLSCASERLLSGSFVCIRVILGTLIPPASFGYRSSWAFPSPFLLGSGHSR